MPPELALPERRKLRDGERIAPHRRAIALRAPELAEALDVEARTLRLTFSSEAPVERWFGREILSHAPGAADLSRLNDGAPLLFNHDPDDVLGVVEEAGIGADRRGYALVRFGKDERGQWAMAHVQDQILRNVSFMYQPSDYVCETDDPAGYSDDDTYTAQRWLAFEISIVSIPADQSVGIGRSQQRSAGDGAEPVRVQLQARTALQAPQASATQAAGEGDASGQPNSAPTSITTTPPIDSKGNTRMDATLTQEDVLKAERQRVEDIVALGRSHSLDFEQVQGMLSRGLTIGEARGEVLAGMLASNPQSPVASLGASNGPDLTDKEKRSYSFLRALQAQVTGDWSKAGFERSVSQDIAKRTDKSTQGFYIPNDLPFAPDEAHLRAWNMLSQQGRVQTRATYQVGAGAQGGNLVQTQLMYDNFVEVLRNQLVTALLGARYLTGLTGNVDIPRQISQTGTYWVGESGGLTQSEATFDKVSLRPRTVGALSRMSRLMMMQSTPAIEMLARQDLLATIALAIDLGALSSPGTGNTPTGLVNQAGVAAVVGGANGANLSFDHLIQLKYATKFANAPQGAAAFAMNSKAVGYLSTLKATTGQYLWEPQGGLTASSPDRVKGSPYAESQQLRSTLTKGTSNGICSELIYGNWQELFIAMWGVTEVMANPYDATGFANGDVVLRAFQTCDYGVRHGASFSVMSDALTPGF